MKRLIGFAALTFINTQALGGYILPDLSRSKSQLNSSPIAVGFSDRNSASLSLQHNSRKADINNSRYYDEKINMLSGSVYYSNPGVHLEVAGDVEKDKTDYISSPDMDSDSYNALGSFALTTHENIRGGVSLDVSKYTINEVTTKSESKAFNITPGIGFKILSNIAIGLGLTNTTDSQKTTSQNSVVTEYPDLVTNKYFVGFAYGVDQKIGENGFGIEAVVTHQPKEKVISSNIIRSIGASTSLLVSGNYIFNMVDLYFISMISTGKTFDESESTTSQLLLLKPEIKFAEAFYVTPQFLYISAKNKSTTGADTGYKYGLFGYGLGAGTRTSQFDVSVDYFRQNSEIKASGFEENEDKLSGRFTFYY